MYGMAARAALPALLARVHPRRRTPVQATVVVAAAAAAFAVLGELALIAAVTDFAVYVVFLAVNGTVVALRRRRPDLPRPFAVPGSVGGVPVIPVSAFSPSSRCWATSTRGRSPSGRGYQPSGYWPAG
jgi:basic amino acid/polyamine antiporter, APA family